MPPFHPLWGGLSPFPLHLRSIAFSGIQKTRPFCGAATDRDKVLILGGGPGRFHRAGGAFPTLQRLSLQNRNVGFPAS
jgi:hypothetical protein